MRRPIHVGVIGCGNVSGQYLQAARSFPILRIAAVADLDRRAACRRAEEFAIARTCSVDELLGDSSIDLVLNLTIPKAHAPVSLAALEAGKHVYSEKPLALSREEGLEILQKARAAALRIGCAPDTFLGAGLQTARKLIDDGTIGRPLAFTVFMMCRGHESWHPNPAFYYEPGGGPMFDMGPYYLTALINFFGPIRRLTGAASIAIPQRTITSQPSFGKSIRVQTPDHVCGTIEFASGVVGTIVTSFATYFPTYESEHPITIYGSGGTLKVPDPNQFDGTVYLRRANDPQWQQVPHAFTTGYGRSVGLADMAEAIGSERPLRASGELAFAVLDAMQGFLESAQSGRAHQPQLQFERPAPMPAGQTPGTFE